LYKFLHIKRDAGKADLFKKNIMSPEVFAKQEENFNQLKLVTRNGNANFSPLNADEKSDL
jgi:hypothetical protein